jgi:hypothetical protein
MIAVIGSPHFGKIMVEELNSNNVNSILITPSLRNIKFRQKLDKHEIIHYLGSPTVTIIGILTLLRFKFWKKKIVVNWIGFDIRRVNTSLFWRFTTKMFSPLIEFHFTEDTESQNELTKINVKSQNLPPPIYKIYSVRDLPKNNKVAVYLPDDTIDDFNFYQGNIIKKLVSDFPNIPFIITRNSGKYFSEKNVTCISFAKNMAEIYEQVVTVIRLPIKDATGVTIIETLSMGREMIASSTTFPFCKIVNSYDDLYKHLLNILKNPTLQNDASEFIHKNYNNKKFVNQLISIYDSIK